MPPNHHPEIDVRETQTQLRDICSEVRVRAKRDERVLVMATTKRDAEDMATYLTDNGVAAGYIHSSLNTQQRADAIKSLQVSGAGRTLRRLAITSYSFLKLIPIHS